MGGKPALGGQQRHQKWQDLEMSFGDCRINTLTPTRKRAIQHNTVPDECPHYKTKQNNYARECNGFIKKAIPLTEKYSSTYIFFLLTSGNK